jgi:hypothetical protein
MTEPMEFFKDFNYKEKFQGLYEIEFKGNSARVHDKTWFVPNVSRFNKLSWHGKTCSGNHYGLTVNGQRAYFISKYEIPK